MSEVWPIDTKKEIINGEISPGRYKCNLMSLRLGEFDDYDFKTKEKTGKKSKKLIFDFSPIALPDKEENGVLIRYSISRFVHLSNSRRGGLVKLLTEMSESGQVPEEIRLNPTKLQEFAEAMLGKGFQVMAGIPEGGKRLRAMSAIPDTTIPYREPKTKGTAFFNADKGGDNEEPQGFCYSLANEADNAKKEQAINVLKKLGAHEGGKDYFVSKDEIKELGSYLVPSSFAGDDIPF